jgi:hypothetical protein
VKFDKNKWNKKVETLRKATGRYYFTGKGIPR